MLNFDSLSYWEKDTYLHQIDFLIIGAGIVGFSTALELRKKHPKAKITILERGYLPTGASSKNAGFSCFGSATELIDDLSHIPEDQVWQTVEMRWKGLQNLRRLIGDQNLDLQINGSWDLITNKEENIAHETAEKLSYLNSKIEAITGEKNVYSIDHEVGTKFGFDHVKSSFYNRLEGQINSGKMIETFVRLIHEANVHCLFGIEAQKIEDKATSCSLTTNFSTISAAKIIICTNGFAQQFLPDEDVHPARAQVLITEPIEDLKLKGTFHYQMGYYYFRNIHNRILLGGGRNLDFKTEETTSFEQTELIKSHLEKLLNEVISPSKKLTIDYFWSGIMGVGSTKKPIIKSISPNVLVGVRLGGMGVAIGSLVGEQLAELAS